jgi:hypothetical protein
MLMIECFIMRKVPVSTNNSRRDVWCRRCLFALPVLAAVMCVLLLSGCGKRKNDAAADEPSTQSVDSSARLKDKEYTENLKKHREDQKVVAIQGDALNREMQAVIARVKEGYGPDVSDETLKAAVEKDEEWLELMKRLERQNQDIRDVLAESTQTVRERMLRDMQKTTAEKKKQ